ncbi:MAG: peptidoglycan DD-metalloendopeptidase family protein [Treponema sp.]|nr:peptidoglycan DD-metalloendopeptidase family protein [Treponema sp.]
MKIDIIRITTAIFFIGFLAGSVSDSLDAMSWPSDDSVLVRNFGANNNGRPVLGMIFEGGTAVLAAENGEIIFSRNKNDSVSRLPSPLGAWTAIDHGDGLISIYSRYEESEPASYNTRSGQLTHVEKNQIIANCGTSGWSTKAGFYFLLFDRRERRWINPAMIITPIQEIRLPQIISVSLLNTQGQLVQSNNLSQGRYTIVVNASAGIPLSVPAAQASGQYAPQRILCSINGAEVGSLNFESVSARDGIQMVSRNGLIPARQVYANLQSYEAAEVFLSRGQITLEVIVQDIVGNSRNTVSRLTVN